MEIYNYMVIAQWKTYQVKALFRNLLFRPPLSICYNNSRSRFVPSRPLSSALFLAHGGSFLFSVFVAPTKAGACLNLILSSLAPRVVGPQRLVRVFPFLLNSLFWPIGFRLRRRTPEFSKVAGTKKLPYSKSKSPGR